MHIKKFLSDQLKLILLKNEKKMQAIYLSKTIRKNEIDRKQKISRYSKRFDRKKNTIERRILGSL